MAADGTFYSGRGGSALPVDEGYIFDGIEYPDLPGLPTTGIVVTPTCDFHQQKAGLTHATVLRVAPLSLLLQALAQEKGLPWDSDAGRIDLRKAGRDKRESVKGFFTNLVNSNIGTFHYLPSEGTFGHSFVSFNAALGVPMSRFENLSFRAALRSPYREHLSTRFSGYYLRVGTQDFPEMMPALLETFATL